MGKALLVAILVIIGLIVLPIPLFLIFGVLSTILPIIGAAMIVGLPALIIGIIIGNRTKK